MECESQWINGHIDSAGPQWVERWSWSMWTRWWTGIARKTNTWQILMVYGCWGGGIVCRAHINVHRKPAILAGQCDSSNCLNTWHIVWCYEWRGIVHLWSRVLLGNRLWVDPVRTRLACLQYGSNSWLSIIIVKKLLWQTNLSPSFLHWLVPLLLNLCPLLLLLLLLAWGLFKWGHFCFEWGAFFSEWGQFLVECRLKQWIWLCVINFVKYEVLIKLCMVFHYM